MRPRTPPPGPPDHGQNGDRAWKRLKEQILLMLGVVIVVATFIWSEVLGHPLHHEWLVFAASLFGLQIALGWGRNEK